MFCLCKGSVPRLQPVTFSVISLAVSTRFPINSQLTYWGKVWPWLAYYANSSAWCFKWLSCSACRKMNGTRFKLFKYWVLAILYLRAITSLQIGIHNNAHYWVRAEIVCNQTVSWSSLSLESDAGLQCSSLKKLKPEESYTTAQHEGFSIASWVFVPCDE